jgi:ADP-L-glycero-D-manno-heptose 6-epimerase
MKILVTGYKGFIGQNMVNALEDEHELSLYEWGESVLDLNNVQWVVHLGAISSTTETDVEKVLTQNLDFSIFLHKHCAEHGINFQYSSSASVYGLGSVFSEDAQPDPKNAYAWSKYLFERYVTHNPSPSLVQGFRYFNVYGPHEDHKGKQASPFHQFAEQAKSTGKIKLFEGSESYLRDFVHVDHVINTHKKFFNVGESGLWNVGTGSPMSFLDVAEHTQSLYGGELEFIPMPTQLLGKYQSYTKSDNTKINECLRKWNV